MSINARDFSFMNEHILHKLFGYFVETRIHINVMQTSALSLSVCFDEDKDKLEKLIQMLENDFFCSLQQPANAVYNSALQSETGRRHHT